MCLDKMAKKTGNKKKEDKKKNHNKKVFLCSNPGEIEMAREKKKRCVFYPFFWRKKVWSLEKSGHCRSHSFSLLPLAPLDMTKKTASIQNNLRIFSWGGKTKT